MSYESLLEVSNDYEKLLEPDEGYDVIIYVGENENVKEFHAFSNILRIRSQYLRNELTKGNVEKSDGKFILKIPNISPHLFKIILRFIYCGKIDWSKLEGPEIFKLLIAADALNLQTIVSLIEQDLINNHHEFLQQNPIGTLEIIYQNENFATLWNFYLEKICEEPETFFNSDKFISIKSPLLELILKRDDLCLEEIDIWDSLIKWGHAQNPSIPKDVKKWSKEETTTMERTLHRLIPSVRFHYISSDDFLEKVLPFRELLPKDMFETTLAIYLSNKKQLNTEVPPPRQPKFYCGSVLVKSQHFAIFSSWIDKKNKLHYNNKNLPYEFNLIYRASDDGMTPAMFHKKCDNMGATIVIIKINGSKQIIGGYNPLEWDSDESWKITEDSFIFSFKNGTVLQTVNVGYSDKNKHSIGCYTECGPLFGYRDLRCDDGGVWSSKQFEICAYSKVDGIPASFKVDDYEVFQVIKI